jgi:hypothetical protein
MAMKNFGIPTPSWPKGMQSTFNIVRPDAPIAIEGPKEPKYELCLQDIDELVEAIFVAASRNPKAYLSMLSDCAREFLTKDTKASRLTT